MDDAELFQLLDGLRFDLDLDVLDDVCEEIGESAKGAQYLSAVFAVIEAHPDADFGAPGAIAHTAETYLGQGYEPALLASLHRQPTLYSVWLLNRLINGSHPPDRERYIRLLHDIANNRQCDSALRDLAIEFAEKH